MATGARNIQWPISRAALLGAAAGLRSQLPLALLVRAAGRDELKPNHVRLDAWLRDPRAQRITTAAAIGELIGDKLPFVPSRTNRWQFIGRLGFGAVAGGIGARSTAEPVPASAAIGAIAAGVSAIAGTTLRTILPPLTRLPAVVIALGEDALAFRLATEAIKLDMSSVK